MGLFDKALKTARDIGGGIVSTATGVGSNIGTSAQDNAELSSVKMRINALDQELDAAYLQVGKKYINYIIDTGNMGGLDVSDMLKMMEPKLEQRKELEQQVIEIEKRIKQSDVLREKAKAQETFEAEKNKLDKALSMDVISQEEYDKKIAVAQKKFDNFEEIRRTEQQFDMGIISKEEKEAKIKELTE